MSPNIVAILYLLSAIFFIKVFLRCISGFIEMKYLFFKINFSLSFGNLLFSKKNSSTIIKKRYIDEVTKNKLLGVYHINDDILNEIILDLKSFSLPETNEKDLITELNDCINRLYNHHLKRKKIEQQRAIELGIESNPEDIDNVIEDSLKTNKLLKEIQSNQKQ